MKSIKNILLVLLLNIIVLINADGYTCPRNSINSKPYYIDVQMKVEEVSDLNHQPFTFHIKGNVCNSTLSDTHLYTIGYGNGPTSDLSELYIGAKLSGDLLINDKDGKNIYNNYENFVTVSINPSNNNIIMKIFKNSSSQ